MSAVLPGLLLLLLSSAAGSVAAVRMARHKMWFNPAKAIRELGLPQTQPKQAFAEAVEWFRTNGYVK
jgi:dihydroflavonol-4-reductase